MIQTVLDNKKFRVAFALLIALPATLVALVTLPYAVIFGLVAIKHLQPLFAILGLAAILGVLGISGAWFRIFKTKDSLSFRQLKYVRSGLVCGIVSTVLLVSVAIWAEAYLSAVLPLLLLLAMGVVFYVGT